MARDTNISDLVLEVARRLAERDSNALERLIATARSLGVEHASFHRYSWAEAKDDGGAVLIHTAIIPRAERAGGIVLVSHAWGERPLDMGATLRAMANKVQARFFVSRVEQQGAPGWKRQGGTVELAPVVQGDGNKEWAEATPSGKITMFVSDPLTFDWFRERVAEPLAITFEDVAD